MIFEELFYRFIFIFVQGLMVGLLDSKIRQAIKIEQRFYTTVFYVLIIFLVIASVYHAYILTVLYARAGVVYS